jgi:hypothetical protein
MTKERVVERERTVAKGQAVVGAAGRLFHRQQPFLYESKRSQALGVTKERATVDWRVIDGPRCFSSP